MRSWWKALCAHGADPNARLTKGSRLQRNLNFYSLSGKLAGATPFWLAAKYAEVEIMRVLAANGADPLLAPNNGITALMAAAGAGWTIRSSNRRDQGIGIDAAQLLVSNSERSTWEATRLALELGGDVNGTDPAGNTALHAAVTLAYPTVVELLVEHGAKLDMENKAGASAEDLACRDGAGKLVRRPGGTRTLPGCRRTVTEPVGGRRSRRPPQDSPASEGYLDCSSAYSTSAPAMMLYSP